MITLFLENKGRYLIPWAGYYSSINTYCSFYDHLNNCSYYYRCHWRRRRPYSFWIIPIKRWRNFETMLAQVISPKRLAGKTDGQVLVLYCHRLSPFQMVPVEWFFWRCPCPLRYPNLHLSPLNPLCLFQQTLEILVLFLLLGQWVWDSWQVFVFHRCLSPLSLRQKTLGTLGLFCVVFVFFFTIDFSVTFYSCCTMSPTKESCLSSPNSVGLTFSALSLLYLALLSYLISLSGSSLISFHLLDTVLRYFLQSSSVILSSYLTIWACLNQGWSSLSTSTSIYLKLNSLDLILLETCNKESWEDMFFFFRCFQPQTSNLCGQVNELTHLRTIPGAWNFSKVLYLNPWCEILRRPIWHLFI